MSSVYSVDLKQTLLKLTKLVPRAPIWYTGRGDSLKSKIGHELFKPDKYGVQIKFERLVMTSGLR